jgi:ATP-binding cassette subfamily C protein CydC
VIYGVESPRRQQLDDIERRWLNRQAQQAKLSALSQALMIAASGLTLCLLLWLAAGGVGSLPEPGALLALFVFTPLAAFEALGPVAGAFQHFGQVMASAERVTQIVSQRPAVVFPVTGASVLPEASISIQGVSFAYPNQPLPVLEDISLDIRAGEHVALLGKTGCGKSTLAQLLTRAWDPQEGRILLNGVSLREYQESNLRSMVSVLSQRVHVFNNTLRDNLLLAAPASHDERLAEVLRQVELGNLLDNDGLNAWLGEGGRQLSGGEQRRLGLARALLHDAPLWILDEPTEGLDAATERHILALLETLGRNKTLLMITHRLAGLDKMDRICKMSAGRIEGHL